MSTAAHGTVRSRFPVQSLPLQVLAALLLTALFTIMNNENLHLINTKLVQNINVESMVLLSSEGAIIIFVKCIQINRDKGSA